MGAEQSYPQGSQIKSQRDEELSYSSISTNRPIDGDTPRSSPRLMNKAKSVSKDQSIDGGTSFVGAGQRKHDIVVVKEGQKTTELDPELQKLENIPMFYPVIKDSVKLPLLLDTEPENKLETRPVLQLCTRYQEHLRQCGEAVAFDQNALCVRIKEVDFAVQTLYNKMTERQKKFAKYADQMQKVQEMNTILLKVQANIEHTLPLMERLNSMLPPEEQLEPFTMSKAAPSSGGGASSASASSVRSTSAGGAPSISAGGVPSTSAGGAPSTSAGGAPSTSAGGASSTSGDQVQLQQQRRK